MCPAVDAAFMDTAFFVSGNFQGQTEQLSGSNETLAPPQS